LASVTIKVNYVATGNFKSLQKQIASLGAVSSGVAKTNAKLGATAKAAGAAATATGGIGQAAIRTVGPLTTMLKAIERNRMGIATLAKTMKASKAIIHEHNMALHASKQAQLSSAGGGKVLMQSQVGIIASTKMMAMQFRMLNTLMVALGHTMIRVGKQIQWAGRQIMVGIGIPLALLGSAANRAAEGYIREMTRVVKVTNFTVDSTSEAFKLQEQSVRRQVAAITELGASMGFLAEESARTVAEFAQMGYVGSSLDAIADAALRLSFTAGADLETSIQLSRIAAQAFGIELNDLTETFARLNLVENNTALSLAELAGALPVVAGVANGVGLSIEQTSGFLAMMKENGISANEGATALRTGLIRMVSEATEPARRAFQNIGLDLDAMNEKVREANGDIMVFFNDLGERLKELEGNQALMNDFTAAIGKLTGTRQAARFIAFLKEIPNAMKAVEVGQEVMQEAIDSGVDYVTALKQAKEAMGDLVGESVGARAFIGVWTESTAALAQYNREQEAIAKSAAGIAKKIRAELNVELAKMGEITLSVTNRLKEMVVSVLKSFNKLSDGKKKAIVAFGLFALGLGTAIMTLGLLLNMFGNITTALFNLMPGLRGKHALMTAQMRAEVTSYNTLTAAIEASNVAKAKQISLNTGITTGSTGVVAANVAAAATAGGPPVPGGAAPAAGATQSAGKLKNAMKMLLKPLSMVTLAFGKLSALLKGGFWRLATIFVDMGGWIAKLGDAMIGMSLKAKTAAKIIRVAMMGTGILGILVIIGLIVAAMMDWKSTTEGFMNTAGPSIQRLKDIFSGLWTMIKELFATFRSEGDAISETAMGFGEAMGKVFEFLVSIFEWVLNTFWPIFEFSIKAIKDLFDFIIKIMSGDFREAFESLGSAVANIGKAILNYILYPVRLVLEAMSKLPGKAGETARAALDVLNRFTFVEERASDTAARIGAINNEMKRFRDLLKDSEGRHEEINETLQESIAIRDELIAAQIISQDYNLDELKTSELITDEQYAHLVIVQEYPEVLRVSNQHLENQRNLNTQIESLLIEINNAEGLRKFRLLEQLEILKAQADVLAGAYTAAVNDAVAKVRAMNRPVRQVRDDFASAAEEVEEINEELEAAVKNAMDLHKALRSAVGDIMGDIKSSLSRLISNQQKAIEDFYTNIAEATRSYFQKFRDGIEENFALIEESIEKEFKLEKERIEGIQKAELDRLDAIEKEMKRQEKMREKFFAAEKARIDFLSGKQISSLQIAEALAKGDVSQAAILRIQQEAAERQFVSDLVQREEANLRELQQEQRDAQRDAANEQAALAILDLEERKAASLEALRNARESYDLQTEAAEEAANAAIEAAIRAADEAREEEEIRIRNYLREWEKVTPATEEEYQRHLKKLERFLDQSGARLNDRINSINSNLQRQLSNISSGFQNENTAVLAELTNSLNASGFAAETALTQLQTFAANTFNQVINSSRLFTTEFSQGLVSSTNLYKDFLKNYQADMYKGFKAARDAAIAVLKEEKKWEDAGRAIQEALRAGAGGTGSGSDGGSGVDLPLLQSGSRGSAVSQLQQALNKASFISPKLAVDGAFGTATDAAVRRFQREYGLAADGKVGTRTWGKLRELGWLHKGGMVGNAMASMASNKPLKSDEMMAVLQKGEYVIQKSAVRSIGSGILDKINTAKRSFSPMQMGSVSMRRPDPGSSSSSESNYYLSFHIDGGNIDEGALAKRVMFEIDKASRNSGGGRRVVSTQ